MCRMATTKGGVGSLRPQPATTCRLPSIAAVASPALYSPWARAAEHWVQPMILGFFGSQDACLVCFYMYIYIYIHLCANAGLVCALQAAEMLGYTKAETLGKNLVENFIQPANRRSVAEVLEKALAGEETSNFELLLLSKFGERYTVLLNATTRRDGLGKVIGVVGVGQDITALNRLMAESKRVADDLTRPSCPQQREHRDRARAQAALSQPCVGMAARLLLALSACRLSSAGQSRLSP